MSNSTSVTLNRYALRIAMICLAGMAVWWMMAAWLLPLLLPEATSRKGTMLAVNGLLALAVAALLYLLIRRTPMRGENTEGSRVQEDRDETRRRRILQFNEVLAQLIRAPGFAEGQPDQFLQHFTEMVSKTIDVSRVSVWRLHSDASVSGIRCLCLWDANSGEWDKGQMLDAATYPSYFEALLSDRTLVFDDVTADERVQELAQDYFPAFSITSMLDAPYHHAGEIGGVLCLEHTGPARKWRVEEQTFVISTSDILSLFFESQRRRELQDTLHRSEKLDALGKLTGGIAHDFNNMLGVIVGFADLLQETVPQGSEQARFAHEIVEAGQRGAKLTSNLLMFSRRQTSNPTVVSINDVLTSQQHMLEKTLTVRIRQQRNLAANLWPVKLDLSDLEHAILNICINAMHAMNGEGELTFSTRNEHLTAGQAIMLNLPAGDYVLLGIRDSGMGMDEETAAKIFEPFFTTKDEEGSGLGLSQVYGFMQRCGGAIEVDSARGNGAIFTFYFPRFAEGIPSINGPERDSLLPSGGTENILVVDDEPALARLAARVLTSRGYSVQMATSAQEALKILANGPPVDLVFSDLVMPGMDGYQLATEVRQKYPSTKIQLTTGYASIEPKNEAASALHENILNKPFTASSLLRCIRAVLDKQ